MHSFESQHETNKHCAARLHREYNIRIHPVVLKLGKVGINGLRLEYNLKDTKEFKSADELLNFVGQLYNKASKEEGGARFVFYSWNKREIVLNGQVEDTFYSMTYDIVTEQGSWKGDYVPVGDKIRKKKAPKKKKYVWMKMITVRRGDEVKSIRAAYKSSYVKLGWRVIS